jgi:hypothetical protein
VHTAGLVQVLHPAEQAWQAAPLRPQPVLQLAQIAALLEVQLAPMAAMPFEHVQVFALQATPFRVQPVLQLAQIAPLLEVQAAPVAAYPAEQAQVLAWQATPMRVQPA